LNVFQATFLRSHQSLFQRRIRMFATAVAVPASPCEQTSKAPISPAQRAKGEPGDTHFQHDSDLRLIVPVNTILFLLFLAAPDRRGLWPGLPEWKYLLSDSLVKHKTLSVSATNNRFLTSADGTDSREGAKAPRRQGGIRCERMRLQNSAPLFQFRGKRTLDRAVCGTRSRMEVARAIT
jgi:hypothetical protein